MGITVYSRAAILAALCLIGSAGERAVAQTSSATLETLYSFKGPPDGTNPGSGLVQGPGDLLYGVAGGGPHGDGMAYSISPTGDVEVLYSFKGTADGSGPNALCQYNGIWYGTTVLAGANGFGTAFALTSNGNGNLAIVHAFTGLDGSQPGPLVSLGNGTLIGTASGGNIPLGVVFSLTTDGIVNVLYNFGGGADGSYPLGITIGKDGNYYGVTFGNAIYGTDNGQVGTIWQLTPAGELTTLHSFTWTDGAQPLAPPIQGADGNLYGTASNGGPNGNGVVYRITPTGEFSILHSFTGTDGGNPRAALLVGQDGNLYGATYTGGAHGWGTLFELTPAGVLITLHDFTNGLDGGSVTAPLIETTSGTFFGVAESGGAQGRGTVFKVVTE